MTTLKHEQINWLAYTAEEVTASMHEAFALTSLAIKGERADLAAALAAGAVAMVGHSCKTLAETAKTSNRVSQLVEVIPTPCDGDPDPDGCGPHLYKVHPLDWPTGQIGNTHGVAWGAQWEEILTQAGVPVREKDHQQIQMRHLLATCGDRTGMPAVRELSSAVAQRAAAALPRK